MDVSYGGVTGVRKVRSLSLHLLITSLILHSLHPPFIIPSFFFLTPLLCFPGTYMVKDISKGSDGSDPSYLVSFKEKVYFSADDRTHGHEIWCAYYSLTL